MPINFLKSIKLDSSTAFIFQDRKEIGIYVFPCKDLKPNQPLFNDGFPSLIVMPRATDEVRLRRKGQLINLKSAWVCCGIIQDTHWEVPEGLEYILVLRFKPSAFYSIFGIDPAMFQSAPVCSLQDLVDDSWAPVIDGVFRMDTISEKNAFLDNVFSSYTTENHLPYFVQATLDYIEERRGNVTVLDLLKRFGAQVNHKWLHRNFVKYLGISPKKYISLQRFIYAYGMFGAQRDAQELLGTALRSGYYDYNHFVKDFKQNIGVAPSRYVWD